MGSQDGTGFRCEGVARASGATEGDNRRRGLRPPDHLRWKGNVICPLLKEALAKKYVPDTSLRVYPAGWEEEMEVGPLPAGKGKRTMGN